MYALTPSLLANIVLGILVALLLCATWIDVSVHRIPNWLVFSGAALGIALNAFLPDGFGFMSALPGAVGFWKSLAGLALGMVILLPLYALRAMGAGDVKLMAMVGAFLGPNAIIGTILMTFLAGGILALLVAMRNRSLNLMLCNVRTMLSLGFIKGHMQQMPTLDKPQTTAGKMPYAIAISSGTLLYFALAKHGYHYAFNLFF